MALFNIRFDIRAATWVKALLSLVLAFQLFACDRTKDVPTPQSPPRPETRIRDSVSSHVGRAVFSYTARPDAWHQSDQPLMEIHRAIAT